MGGASARSFLTADWRLLAMLNWKVERSVLEPFVPAATELDDWNGAFYASVVGFLFERTRVLGVHVPFHGTFEEVNLRFYVRRKIEGGFRRGVVFVRELVPRRLVALIARRVYHENYAAVPMTHAIGVRADGSPARVEYSWTHAGVPGRIALTAAPGLRPLASGSVEEFLAEHYYGYVRQPDGATLEYAVRSIRPGRCGRPTMPGSTRTCGPSTATRSSERSAARPTSRSSLPGPSSASDAGRGSRRDRPQSKLDDVVVRIAVEPVLAGLGGTDDGMAPRSAHAWTRACSGTNRSTACRRTSGRSSGGPNSSRSSRTPRTRASSGGRRTRGS